MSWMLRSVSYGFLCLVVFAPAVLAQGTGGGGLGGGGLGGGGLGGGRNQAAGIVIDAEGMVQLTQVRPLPPAALKKQVEKYAKDQLAANVIAESPERTLSLKGLEAILRDCLDKKQPTPEAVLYLAGLQRIDVIAFDPEEKDVYLVGPAEGFGPDQLGRMVGQTTGRPPLLLDDLVTALRATSKGARTISCSIDPSAENLSKLQQYLQANSYPASTAQVQQRYRTMATVLGQQVVTVEGVPMTSHFSLALVEADYRMKRISLGLESAGVPGIKSQLSLLKPQGNSLQRWWFVPMYDPLETNQAGTVYRIKGQRAKLLAQEEISDAGGHRSAAAMTRQSTERFAQLFTENFQELADKSTPFAALQNLFDVAMLGMLIREQGARHLGPGAFPTLMADERLQTAAYPVPRYVSSESTFRASGAGSLIGLVGGVTMDFAPLLRAPNVGNQLSPAQFRGTATQQGFFGDGAGN